MNRLQYLRIAMVSLATLGMLPPAGSFAAAPAVGALREQTAGLDVPEPPLVLDIALGEGGILHGQVVDQQGTELAGVAVHVLQNGRAVAETLTDSHGRFEFRALQGGIYQIEAARAYATCRLWSPRTAPPTARGAAMIVAGGTTVRGQWGNFMSNRQRLAFTLIAATMIATAIAVPLALSSGNNNGS